MKTIITLLLAAVLSLTGCNDVNSAPAVKQTQAKKAEAAANSLVFVENAEIDNIKRRLQLTANPGLLGYVVLFNDMGQPVMYTGVKGKVTSGGKRLTKPYEWARTDCGQYGCDKDVTSASDEGTYGTSGEYVYFWTVSDQYVQWNGHYLYSDKPFRLNAQPLVLDVKTGS